MATATQTAGAEMLRLILPDEMIAEVRNHEPERAQEIAFRWERAIIKQQRNVTKEFLLLGALLHEFDEAKLWRHTIDVGTEEPHTSLTAWLEGNGALDRTKCLLALQTWRLYVIRYDIPVPALMDIAPSKFVDLNPAISEVEQEADAKVAAVNEAAARQVEAWRGQDGQMVQVALQSAAMQIQDIEADRERQVSEWVEAGSILSRSQIRSKRKEDTGWIVKTWRVNLQEPKTLANLMRDIIKLFRAGEVEITAKQSPDW